jgi:protein-S-isoprenylcysteine O-methyltransferase Ste14
VLRLLLAALMSLCVGSFVWSVRRFFTKPRGSNAAMNITIAGNALIAGAEYLAILFAPTLSPRLAAIGVLLYAAGLALFWSAIWSNSALPLAAIYTPQAPEHLVQNGVYRYIRHPFYTSYLITWAAGIVATGAIWLLPMFVIMLGIYIHASRAEERQFSNSALAKPYEVYKARTGRFLPNVVGLMSSPRPR